LRRDPISETREKGKKICGKVKRPATGEGGDWWSRPMGVKAKGTPRVCQGEKSNFHIPGIPTISFPYKLYFQRKKVQSKKGLHNLFF